MRWMAALVVCGIFAAGRLPAEEAKPSTKAMVTDAASWQRGVLRELIARIEDPKWWDDRDEKAGIRRALSTLALSRVRGSLYNYDGPEIHWTRIRKKLMEERPTTSRWAAIHMLSVDENRSIIDKSDEAIRRDFEILKLQFRADGGLPKDLGDAAMIILACISQNEMAINAWHEFVVMATSTQCEDGRWHGEKISDETLTAMVAAALMEGRLRVDAKWADAALGVENKAIKWIENNKAGVLGDVSAAYFVQRIGLWKGGDVLRRLDIVKAAEKTPAEVLDRWGDSPRETRQALALLALVDADRNLGLAKLNYGAGWDERPRDVANLSVWVGKMRCSSQMRWRDANINAEIVDAPVLVITGSQDREFSDEQAARIRRYIDHGGIVLSASGEGPGGKAFTEAMIRLAEKAVGGKYQMRALPPDHIMYSQKNQLWKGVRKQNLFGMSNGVREVWVHCTTDAAKSWQEYKITQGDDFYVAMNVFLYVTTWNSAWLSQEKNKCEETTLPPVKTKLAVGRVKYDGNWNAEPAAWETMQNLSRQCGVELSVDTFAAGELKADRTPMAHLSVARGSTFDDEAVAALKKYVDAGGMLLIDAAGGNDDASKIATELSRRLAAEEKWQTIADNEQRSHTRICSLRKKTNDRAAIEEVRSGGKLQLVMSRGDLSAGMAGIPAMEIEGFNIDAARDAVMKVISEAAK